MQYLVALFILAFITGSIGRAKGSSFFIWFLVGALLPVIGLLLVSFSRTERRDPRRECPNCGNLVGIATQVCPRCGEDMDYPEELVAPKGFEFDESESDEATSA